MKRDLKNTGQLNPLARIDVPRRTLRGTPPYADDTEDHEDTPHSEGIGTPDAGRGRKTHGLPPWCEYSDDPNDYADHADYLADWWKRPQPSESTESGDTPDQNPAGGGLEWLRCEMRKAVEREDYERAAELRDQIQKREEDDRQGSQ